jgi:hypothetical protein
MLCVRKRGHERHTTSAAVNEIAFRMGYLSKRVLVFDSESSRRSIFSGHSRRNNNNNSNNNNRSRSPDEKRTRSPRDKGKDISYWSQMAATLSNDVKQLKEDANTRQREYSSLFELNSKLLASFKEIERKMVDAERELNYLRTDPFQESSVYHTIVSTVPVNTQGRDAIYWHQMCRTIQSQFLHAQSVIDDITHKER